LRRHDSDVVVIMMTAYSNIENAVEATKLGAYDYIPKPFDMDEMLLTAAKALETTRLRREVRELRRRLKSEFGFDRVIGQHESMLQLFDVARKVAESGASTIFLRGETGTGKDLIARVIHHNSDRAASRFMNITCTALSESLLESELFGHEKGAFTDAKSRKIGLFELADAGSVFLDEVGDMPLNLQAKLLRFLEERTFRRVGGADEIKVNVRILAATNRNIEEGIAEGRFRSDLFYRLNVVPIDLPPLRRRGKDVILLANHFFSNFSAEFKKTIDIIEPACYEKLMHYHWPGNVRELRNVCERAVLLCSNARICPDDILPGRDQAGATATTASQFELPPGGIDLGELEQHLLKQALVREDNNQTKAAALLHLSRDTFRYRLEKHGLL
jgi:DNA-binding NtrC family response regulator